MFERKRSHGRPALAVGVAVLVLGAVACKSSSAPAAAPKPMHSGMMSESPGMMSESPGMMSESPGGNEAMMMQPGADKMHTKITSPASGTTVTKNDVVLHVAATGYQLSCDHAGKQDVQGIGHYHVLLDGSLVNMFCTPAAEISMQNVHPGRHTLEAVPAQDDHTEIKQGGDTITFNYKPSNPLPTIKAAQTQGSPSISILQPADGSTVSGNFTVKVQISNYNTSCNLMGKPDVTGYGHWHVNLDQMTGPMMGMGTMLGMSCTNTFQASTIGLQPGQTHTLIALLTDNGHAPTGVQDQVTIHIGG